MKLEQRLEQLKAFWPDLVWSDARLEECDHDVVILDDIWVFRFACKVADHEPLRPEIAILERLRDQIGLAVPHYTHIAPNHEVAGYAYLKGASFDADSWEKFDSRTKKKAATDLAQMLNVVHGFSLGAARSLGIGKGKGLWPRWRKDLRNIPRLSGGVLTTDELAYCEQVASELLSLKTRALHTERVLIQGDMYLEHILLDDNGLCGVIDWGDICIADPAVDLIYFYCMGEGFFDDFLSRYDYASEGLKRRTYWLWLRCAISSMRNAARSKDRQLWRRGYEIFPKDVADPKRIDGFW